MEVLSIDDRFDIESELIPADGTVEDLASIIETKKSINSMDFTLYTNGKRLHRAEKLKNIKWGDGVQYILHPDVPMWNITLKINSFKKAQFRIPFPYPERNTIYDLLQKISERLSLSEVPHFRQLKFQSYGSLHADAGLQTIANYSCIKLILKTEKDTYDQSDYILVNIRIENDDSISFFIKISSRISKLKWLLACKGKRILRLVYNGAVLDDNETIHSYRIQDHACIEGHKGALGGSSGYGFTFADISEQKQVILKFNEQAPRWRSIKRGISFITHCRNRYCEAGSTGDWIIVNKGVGVFSIGETITSLKCPACDKKACRAENCGFFDCKWRFKGEKEDENEGFKECGERVAGKDAYYTFAESNERWIYLKVEARERDGEFLMAKNN